jgi:AraC-like DNA-binding protein
MEEFIEVAEEVGYSSEASFNRVFKKQFRLNPCAMRRALQSS